MNQPNPAVPAPVPTDPKRLAVECARIADNLRAEKIRVLEMGPLIEITDYFVLASGNNRRQIRAITEEIIVQMKARGIHRHNLDGLDTGVWVLTDFSTVVVHVFNEEAREYYDLDGLWADAPEIDWQHEPGFDKGEKPEV